MGWKAQLTVQAVSGNTVCATGDATGTDDDVNVTSVMVIVNHSSTSHLEIGSTFDLEADC